MEVSSSSNLLQNGVPDISQSADDSLISPYTSPQRDQFASEVNFASGDYAMDAENNHLLANHVYASVIDRKTTQAIEDLQETLDNIDPRAGGEGMVIDSKEEKTLVQSDDGMVCIFSPDRPLWFYNPIYV